MPVSATQSVFSVQHSDQFLSCGCFVSVRPRPRFFTFHLFDEQFFVFRGLPAAQLSYRIAADIVATESEMQSLLAAFDRLQINRLVYYHSFETSSSSAHKEDVAMFDRIFYQHLSVPPPPSISPQPAGPTTPSTSPDDVPDLVPQSSSSADSLPSLESTTAMPDFPFLIKLSSSPQTETESPEVQPWTPLQPSSMPLDPKPERSRSRSASPIFKELQQPQAHQPKV